MASRPAPAAGRAPPNRRARDRGRRARAAPTDGPSRRRSRPPAAARGSNHTRFRPTARAYSRTRSSRVVNRSRSASRFVGESSTGGECGFARRERRDRCQARLRPRRCPTESARSVTIFSAVQSPACREISTACSPSSRSLIDRGRREHRHPQRAAGLLAAAGHGRGLGHRVVPDERDGTAQRGGAGEVAVADRVGGAVEAGRLAVPEARHALLGRARQLAEQLRARRPRSPRAPR